jgi:hypothetical protein
MYRTMEQLQHFEIFEPESEPDSESEDEILMHRTNLEIFDSFHSTGNYTEYENINSLISSLPPAGQTSADTDTYPPGFGPSCNWRSENSSGNYSDTSSSSPGSHESWKAFNSCEIKESRIHRKIGIKERVHNLENELRKMKQEMDLLKLNLNLNLIEIIV